MNYYFSIFSSVTKGNSHEMIDVIDRVSELHIIENDQERLIYADIRKPGLSEVFKALTKKK